ncbi:MAG: UDP-N-acetylmuramoyl-L-alanine--D-glutamate ligase [Spiribacter sp.]|nr:UDP-N-acetylmuramoyl-L-alanine--D-glutamate ligase [Spiribacter sp.]
MQKAPVLDAVVIGLGESGWASVRHLSAQGYALGVIDTRSEPPHAARLKAQYPDIWSHFGDLEAEWLPSARKIVLSPGVDPRQPALQRYRDAGGLVLGEIELFARAAKAPVIAITGSNGKSTVTRMVAAMAREAGVRALAGGNLGPPALDLLQTTPAPDCYVLELSSFQLETTQSLQPQVSAVLNLSPDHLDRYADMPSYAAAKARILNGAEQVVLNADDAQVAAMAVPGQPVSWFSNQRAPASVAWRLAEHKGQTWLCHHERAVIAADQMPVVGRHNALNALAALAIGEAAGWPEPAMCRALAQFEGLPHRSESLGMRAGRLWVNDSKATNVAAAIAAIEGSNAPVVLIAGGQGKGQDFTPLASALAKAGRAAVLFGEDATPLARSLADAVPVSTHENLASATAQALALSAPGDVILLAPACASFDQFSDYQARGECFRALVAEVADE